MSHCGKNMSSGSVRNANVVVTIVHFLELNCYHHGVSFFSISLPPLCFLGVIFNNDAHYQHGVKYYLMPAHENQRIRPWYPKLWIQRL